MDIQTFAGFSHSLQTIAAAVLVFAICAYVPTLTYTFKVTRLPVFGGPKTGEKQRQKFMSGAKSIYQEAYTKFRDRVFVIASAEGEDRVVVPPSMLPEVRKLHDDVVSFPKAMEKFFEVKYTKLELRSDLPNQATRSDLTPALFRLNDTFSETVDETLREFMPACNDWTEIFLSDKLALIIARVSGRFFVGPEVASDPEYLDCSVNYTMSLIGSSRAIAKLRPWLRPFLAPRLPEVRKLRDYEAKAKTYLLPIIRERLEAAANDPNYQAPDDMMTWLLKRMDPKQNIESKVDSMVRMQLLFIMAAIHTTSMTMTNIIYTLAVQPEYVEPLREEVRNVLAQNNGKMSPKALQQVEKLDSYMKEVFRVYPPGITSFQRRVTKDFTFSNGQHIPAGVILEIPSYQVYSDSAHYPDAESFDGFRHYKLRRNGSSTDHARNQFVTVNETNMGFGYGKHACPGRFFAANEMKLILSRLILDYDMKMPNGETERYAQIELGRASFPHPKKALLFKKVEV